MNATKRIIATLALATGMAVAGGLWTQELNVGTNGVTLAATHGILTVRGSVIPPVADRARLVLRAANGTVPVLAIFEGAGVTAE